MFVYESVYKSDDCKMGKCIGDNVNFVCGFLLMELMFITLIRFTFTTPIFWCTEQMIYAVHTFAMMSLCRIGQRQDY